MRLRVGALAAASAGRLASAGGRRPGELGGGVWLVGAGGWGDARAGGDVCPIALNDEEAIGELNEARGRGELGALLARLGAEAARALGASLGRMPAGARRVLVLAHVPPFPGAAWHEGRPSEAAFQQRFCWAAGGEMLTSFAAVRAEVELVVLCGHTHGGGFLWVSPNLVVITAPAVYGTPRLTRFAADAPAEAIARAAGALPPPVGQARAKR